MSNESEEIDFGVITSGTREAWHVHVKYQSKNNQDKVELDCLFSLSQTSDGASARKYMIMAEIQLPSHLPSNTCAYIHFKSPSLNDEASHQDFQFLFIDYKLSHFINHSAKSIHDVLTCLSKNVFIRNISSFVRRQLVAAVHFNRMDILRRELQSDQLDLQQLHIAFDAALMEGKPDIMLELLAGGATIDMTKYTEAWKSYALMTAVQSSRDTELLDYFPVHEMEEDPSLLKSFAVNGHTDMVLEWLNRGADIGTALFEAVSSGDAETVRLLVDRQVSVMTQGPVGRHILDHSSFDHKHQYGRFHEMNTEIFQLLVDAVIADATISAPKVKPTWFYTACNLGLVTTVDAMLSAGIDSPNMPAEYWNNLLFALHGGQVDVARLLLLRNRPPSRILYHDDTLHIRCCIVNFFCDVLQTLSSLDQRDILNILLHDLVGQFTDYTFNDRVTLRTVMLMKNLDHAEILIEHGVAITDNLLMCCPEFMDASMVRLLLDLDANLFVDAAKVNKAVAGRMNRAQHVFPDDVMRCLVHAGVEGLITDDENYS